MRYNEFVKARSAEPKMRVKLDVTLDDDILEDRLAAIGARLGLARFDSITKAVRRRVAKMGPDPMSIRDRFTI